MRRTLVMLAGGIFIAPFFLFSGASGTLADRIDKSRIARWVKIAEIFIMAIGAAGFAMASVPLLLIALFGLGTHSTVFGPIKYALLPEHLADHELVAGNALIEAGTFLAILFGTILGGSLMLIANGALVVGILGVAVALAGWISARLIPAAPPSSSLVTRPRLLHDSIDVVRYVASRDDLFLPVLALSWFWLVGGTLVSGLPVFAKDVLFADEQVVTLMLAVFAIGIARRIAPRRASAARRRERALRADLGAGDGGVRVRPVSGQRGTGTRGIGQHLVACSSATGELARARRPAGARRRRRLVHGAALRAAAACQRAGASRARDRRQQHRQLAVHDRRGGVRRLGAGARPDHGRAVRPVRHPDAAGRASSPRGSSARRC